MDRAEKLKKYLKYGKNGASEICELKNVSSNEEQNSCNDLTSKYSVHNKNISWDSIAGLESVKLVLKEHVILPIKFPNLFVNSTIRWRGVLIFGPPGVGKTYLIRALATELKNSTFLSLSAYDLISKWVGDCKKLVRELFDVAREKSPAILTIDDIDSLTAEDGTPHEAKLELLIQSCNMKHAGLLVGVTSCPWKINSTFRRSFQKRIYIPLPDLDTRIQILKQQVCSIPNLNRDEIVKLAEKTAGFSGSELITLVKDALMEPIREIQKSTHFKKISVNDSNEDIYEPCKSTDPQAFEKKLEDFKENELRFRQITIDDLFNVLNKTSPCTSKKELEKYEDFYQSFC